MLANVIISEKGSTCYKLRISWQQGLDGVVFNTEKSS